MYGIPFLNYQRGDHVRGLQHFVLGKPIGNSLPWLMAHVAGQSDGWLDKSDKPSRLNFERRIAWVKQNLVALRDVGDAILNGKIPPRLAKDPIQFAAACAELKQAIDIGPSFETKLPLTFDGSCSGLQHLCAMTRAPEGRLVNLTAEDEAQDFYLLVANKVWDSSPACREIMEGRDDRDLVKRPVMTYFYDSIVGGHARTDDGGWITFGATEQILSVLKERGQWKGAKLLAEEIHNAIRALVPAAEGVKEYLKDLVKLHNRFDKPLRWTTPLGFPVLNLYQKPDIRTIKTRLGGRVKKTNIVVGDLDELRKQKAINSVCANFVHALDGSHRSMRSARLATCSMARCSGARTASNCWTTH